MVHSFKARMLKLILGFNRSTSAAFEVTEVKTSGKAS